MARAPVAAAVLLLVLGCGGRDLPPAAGGEAPSRVAQVTGLSAPESVRYDPDQDLYFVSSVVGNPGDRDGQASILVLGPEGEIRDSGFVRGGARGVVLNAPKGMVLVGDTLWVTDIDAVRGFDRHSGAPVASIDLAPLGATFLNDIAAGPDGILYITDTGLKFDAQGEMSHAGPDRIFQIRGRTPAVALESAALAGPNGITWDSAGRRFLVVPLNGTTIVAWAPGDTAVTPVATGPGGFDGVEMVAGAGVLATSWADSSLWLFQGDSGRSIVSGVNGPADIGIDTRRHRVAIPSLAEGRVEIWTLPGQAPSDPAERR